MNSIERIKAVIAFQTPDRPPVIAQVFGHAAALSGVALRDYVKDGEVLARCQLQALNRYKYDAVFALMDAGVETEALGSRLTYSQDRYPYVQSYALSEATDVAGMSPPDPGRDARMPELLKALRIMRREVGDDVLVVGCVLGPMTLATQLLGAEKTLFLAIDEPEKFTRLLDFATEVSIAFGVAQIVAGAHVAMVFDPSASPAVIPRQFFREFPLKRLQKIFSALKGAGAVANWLHIAGPTASILPFYPQLGIDIAAFDYCASPEEVMQLLPQTCVTGNIKSLSFLSSPPEEIARESSRLLELYSRRGGFILSSGCEIPPEANPENISAMVAACR